MSDLDKKLTGKEEHIGGFDLVYSGAPIKAMVRAEGPPTLTLYSSLLLVYGTMLSIMSRRFGCGRGRRPRRSPPSWVVKTSMGFPCASYRGS